MSAVIYLLRGLFAFLGRLVGQTLGARRELDHKRRDVCLQALIEAWRSLERATVAGIADDAPALDRALADIQLFGTPTQAAHAAQVAYSLDGGTGTPAVDDLLEALRHDIREEMRLGRAMGPLVRVRGAASRPCAY
jgi:hypothetical protein